MGCAHFKKHYDGKKMATGHESCCRQGGKSEDSSDSVPNTCIVLLVIDYGFGLMTLADTHLNRLDSIQNEAMRIILGCTRDTSAATMRHYLDLPTMKKRHQMAQVQTYLRVTSDKTNPLHEKVGRITTSRLKGGTDWMSQTMLRCGCYTQGK